MATLRPRLSLIVLIAVAIVLLATAGVRMVHACYRPCRGTIEAESLWRTSPASDPRLPDAIARAETLTARRPAILIREDETQGWNEGGSYERDWSLGDLVAYERGGYYRSRYPSSVTIGLANACDDRTVLHDGYHTDALEARHDPETGLWYAINRSGDRVSLATPIRIVEMPGAMRFTPRASFFFFVAGTLLFAIALFSLARGRRYAALQRLQEAIVIGKDGRATTTAGAAMTLEPPPPLGALVLVVDSRTESAPAAPYRQEPERTTARWLPWSRERARRGEMRVLAIAAALYVLATVLGFVALVQTS